MPQSRFFPSQLYPQKSDITQKWILPSVCPHQKMENPTYFFLELAVFSGNLVYDVVFGTEFANGIFEYIQSIFTPYFGDNMIFRDFFDHFFVPPIIWVGYMLLGQKKFFR